MKYLSGWKLLGLLIEPGLKIGVLLARLLVKRLTGSTQRGGDPSALSLDSKEKETGEQLVCLMDGEAGEATVKDMHRLGLTSVAATNDLVLLCDPTKRDMITIDWTPTTL